MKGIRIRIRNGLVPVFAHFNKSIMFWPKQRLSSLPEGFALAKGFAVAKKPCLAKGVSEFPSHGNKQKSQEVERLAVRNRKRQLRPYLAKRERGATCPCFTCLCEAMAI